MKQLPSNLQNLIEKPSNPRAFVVSRRKTQRILQKLGFGLTDVLDLGGGTGRMTEGLEARTTIFDFDEKFLRVADALGFRTAKGDLNDPLPFHDGEFGAAILSASLGYAHDPGALMDEVGRVVRPGAPVVVTMPNAASFSQILKLITRGDVKPCARNPLDKRDLLQQYTVSNGRKFFEAKGWRVERITADLVSLPWLAWLQSYELAGILGGLFPRFGDTLIFVVRKI